MNRIRKAPAGLALRRRALFNGALALAVLLLVWWLLGRWYGERLLAQQRAEVSAALAPYAGSLHAALARRFAALDALRVSVQADRLDVALELRFEAFANGLAAGAEGIRSFTVAPGGVVQYVSPLAGNERALGRDLLNGPQSAVSDAARRAVQTRRITLSPPDGLREGAALAAWQAVYLGDRFWGIVALELEAAPVLAEAGLAPGPAVLRLALRDGQGRMLHGDARLFDSDAMIARVELPEGAWELAATPARGWNTALQENLLAVQGAGLLAAAALAGLVYLISNRQAALERAVQQRTSELRRTTAALETDIAERQRAEARLGEREEQYRRIFEETTDGLILNDENGAIVEANPAAYRMHGYSYQEFILLSPTAIIHPESFPLFRRFQETVAAGAGFRTEALDVRKDGSVFPVEVRGSLMMYRGRPHHLAMLRDITEQVEATQILERRVEERTRELSTLLEVSHTLASTLEVGPLVRSALRQLKELVDYTGAAVMAVQGDRLIALEYRGPMNARQLAHVGAWWDTLPDHRRLLNMTETVSIGDVLDGDPRNTTFMEAADEGVLEAMGYVRSLLTVPLLIQERPVGVLRLDHREAHHFTPEHVALATAFANQMAVAFENARLYQEEHERRAEAERRREAAEGLSDILAIVNSNRPLDDILEAIMAHAAALLGAKRAAIFRLDADSQTLHIQAARGLPPEYFTTVRLPVGEGVIGRAVSERRPVVISQFRADTAPSMQRDPRQHPNLAWLEREVRTILGVPLLVKSETYGGIALYYAEQRVFSAEDLGLATALGDQAALAIENARLHQAEQDRRAEAERRRRAAEGLRDILSIINSNRPLGDILDAVMTQAGHLLQTDTLAIYRLDPATRLLRIQAARGLPNEYVAALAVPLDQGMIGRAAQQRRPLGMTFATTAPPDDLYRDARNDPEQREHLAWFYRTFRAVLTAPLFIKGELYGGIVLYYQEAREFTEDDIGLAAALGDQAALAIENARLFAEALDKAALEERQRLARELHDSVSQALYGIALGARTARTLLDRDPSRVAAPLDYVLSLAEAGLAEMRALIFQLRPESLQSEGLAAGLAKAAASLRARHGIEVETDFGEEPDLPPAVKEALYRIAQEAMHNTVKHARAKKVAVTLRSDGTLATLEVRDDGVGFDPSGSFPGHLGLKSMRERAARLGGRLDITSAPETGAVIRVQIPANGA